MEKPHGLLSDWDLIVLARDGAIVPFEPEQVKVNDKGERCLSYGVSSYGYDVRLGTSFKVANNLPLTDSDCIDPKEINDQHFTTVDTDQPFLIPPNGFVLGHTVETFDLPNDVLIIAMGKSTYARAGLSVSITPIEPGFRGQVVIEIANHTPKPVKLYPNEGISQFLFFRGMSPCLTSYADRGGKYQDQTGVTHSKV